MNASALLTAQGWRGKGHSLHKTDDAVGLAKPLLLNRKDNTRGIGATQHFTSDQWWMNAFDEQLQGLDTSKKGKVVQTITTGKLNAIEKGSLGKYSLYATFVRGGLLEGTIEVLNRQKHDEDESATESESDAADKKPKKTAEKKSKRTTEKRSKKTTEKNAKEATEKKTTETTEKKPNDTTEKKSKETTEKKSKETTEKKSKETTEKKSKKDGRVKAPKEVRQARRDAARKRKAEKAQKKHREKLGKSKKSGPRDDAAVAEGRHRRARKEEKRRQRKEQ